MSGTVGKNRARFSLISLNDALKHRRVSVQRNLEYEGVVTDSREVQRGNIFVALKGERFDGHDFISQIARVPKVFVVYSDGTAEGLAAVHGLHVPDTQIALGDLARYHRRRFEIPVVAVTGSYGKTTTRALISAALSAQLNVLQTEGNFNNEVGLPMTLLQLDDSHEAAVLEMGMRGRSQIEYLAKIAEPSVGVITNVGPQHIELLGSEQEIARAKGELLQALPPEGLAVLPSDSPYLELLKSLCACRIVTFGASDEADYRVENVRQDTNGRLRFAVSTFRIGGSNVRDAVINVRDGAPETNDGVPDVNARVPDGNDGVPDVRAGVRDIRDAARDANADVAEGNRAVTDVVLPLLGAHNAINAAAAIAIACELGVPLQDAARALAHVEIPGARMRIVHANGITIIDDCYNAGPDSMRAALQTLRDFPGATRRVAYLGAMRELGEHSERYHREIGALAAEICDVIVGVGQETAPLCEAVTSAGEELVLAWCPETEQAAYLAANDARFGREGDVILVKGSRSVGLESVVEALRGARDGE